jgi:CDP-diacylglycerol--serine O-phosphatidyltransferase
MMFIGKYNKSVIVTYLGVIAALIGSYLAVIMGTPRYAVLCLIIAGLCDLFDGMFARMCKRDDEEKAFGIQIDSLADMVSFVFLPICIGYSVGLDKWYHIAVFALYTLAVIIRLGYFNITADGKSNEPVDYYRGLPVTYAALILSVVWLLTFVCSTDQFAVIYAAVLVLLALLFVINIRVPKPKGKFYVIFPLVALALICTIVFVRV